VDFGLVNYDKNAACHKTLYSAWLVRKPILLINKDELVFDTLESILKTGNLAKEYSVYDLIIIESILKTGNLDKEYYVHELIIK